MKDTTRSAVIAGLAILAVAFAASTLESTVVPESSGPGGPDGRGGGDGGLLPSPESGSTPGEALQIPFLAEILTLLVVLATLALVAYVFVYRRETLGIVLAGVALLGLLFVLFQLWPSSGGPPSPPMVETGDGGVFGESGGGGESGTTRPLPPVLVLLLVLGLAIAGAVVAVFRTGTGASDSGEPDEEDASAAAVGRTAGRAADRLEETADVDNEVYRAWQEMTELLDVDDPGTRTPGQFAAAAVEAGLGREDVDELTRLFEDVRYGEQHPSEEYERRAIAVFRRIEDRYTGDDS